MSLQKESVSEKLVKRDSDNLRKNGEQLKAIRLQNKNEWEKEFVRRFVNNHGTHWRPLRGLWTEEVIEFIYEVISQREKEIADEVEKKSFRGFAPYEQHYLIKKGDVLSILKH